MQISRTNTDTVRSMPVEINAAMAGLDRLVPVNEALGFLGLGMTRFYDEVAAGRLEMIKSGRRSFVKASEITRYVDALPRARSAKAA
jgi:hypothetical protein